MTLQDQLPPGLGIHWHMSSCGPKHEPTFRKLLDSLRPTRIVEIGTHMGVSAALLAEYAPVTTVDVFPSKTRERVWSTLRVSKRITSHVCVASAQRDRVIAEAIESADLAFVDGSHLMPDVVRDFDLTIPCGRVILHDYWQSARSWPDVKEFVDALDRERYRVRIAVPFALVEAL